MLESLAELSGRISASINNELLHFNISENVLIRTLKEVPYSIMSVGHEADPGFLAVSQQMTLVGCHYFRVGR